MIEIYKDQSLMSRDIPFGILDVQYPDRSAWDLAGFAAMRDQELAAIKSQAETYDRKAEFSEDPYFRYFRKHKKTYPVMAQLESFLLKRPPFSRVQSYQPGGISDGIKDTHADRYP